MEPFVFEMDKKVDTIKVVLINHKMVENAALKSAKVIFRQYLAAIRKSLCRIYFSSCL